jgi:hypothetical protein
LKTYDSETGAERVRRVQKYAQIPQMANFGSKNELVAYWPKSKFRPDKGLRRLRAARHFQYSPQPEK